MKRLLIMLITIPLACMIYAQVNVKYSSYVDGYWSPWKEYRDYLHGNYSQILAYDYGRHPSEFVWRFTINNYYTPSKDQIKYHYKNNIWWEYRGTFEYYITDEYPNAKSQLLKNIWVAPWNHVVAKGQMPCVKKNVNATIKIAPYKNHPKCYNIYFEGVGFAIDLCDTYFGQ